MEPQLPNHVRKLFLSINNPQPSIDSYGRSHVREEIENAAPKIAAKL